MQSLEPGALPPTKTARGKCWAARDAYFECLDQHKIWLRGLGPQTHQDIISIEPTHLNIASESDKMTRIEHFLMKHVFLVG